MKVRIKCKIEKREQIAAMLSRGGFEVSEEGIYIFYENNYMSNYIIGKAKDDNGDMVMLKFTVIFYFESFGHDIDIVTDKGKFGVKDKLYQLENDLPPQTFTRISQSAIINRNNIKKISPGIGMHYFLTMKNGSKLDVTRSYYYKFKSEVGI